MTAVGQDGLFDVVADLAHLADRQATCQRLRDQLVSEIGHCDRELHRLRALAHAVRELIDDRDAAAVATRLAERGWSGSGEQLAITARAIVAQAGPS